MEESHKEEHLVAKHQNRLRDALARLSEVCHRNAKLTETVSAKSNSQKKYGATKETKPSSLNNQPPTPPQRTVSFSRLTKNKNKTYEKFLNKPWLYPMRNQELVTQK